MEYVITTGDYGGQHLKHPRIHFETPRIRSSPGDLPKLARPPAGQVIKTAAVPVEEAEQLKKNLHTLTGTASAIRVIIETRDSDTSRTYSTVGVGTNIIEASWRALVDAVEFKLWKDDDRWAQQGQFEDVAGIAAAAAASSASAASASEVPQRTMQ